MFSTTGVGSLVLSADQPIAAFASIIDNTSLDPSMEAPVEWGRGSSFLSIPSITNRGAFRSSLVVKNLFPFEGDFSLIARNPSGDITATFPVNHIQANGIVEFPDILTMMGVEDQFGPLEISTNGQVSMAAVSRVYSRSATGGTNGGFMQGQIGGTSHTVLIPYVVDTTDFRTNLGLTNLNFAPVTASVSLFSRDGQFLANGHTAVAPKGLTQINAVVRKLLNNPSNLDLTLVPDSGSPSKLDGYLQIMSSITVNAWASQIANANADPSIEVGHGNGYIRQVIPSSTNTGLFRSALVLVNTESVVAQVEIVSRNAEGVHLTTMTTSLPPNGQFVENDILTSMGITNSYGPLEIRSTNGVPVVAISRVYSSNGTSAYFEGRPLD
jgi:hypothetical protein